MDILIKDKNFNSIKPIDSFRSSIWTIRYNSYGDFELELPITNDIFDLVGKDYYLDLKDSDRTMIIEGFEIETDVEEGPKLIMSGRSLESILTRRIIWSYTILNGPLQSCVEQLLNENIINPSDSDRKIPNFIFEPSSDPEITKLDLSTQYHGENLYDVISSICVSYNIGFSITLSENNNFIFRLYKGVDRSYEQLENPYVIFSPKFENINNSSYLESILNYKNIALVAGDGEGSHRALAVAGDSSSDLERRELFLEAKDVSREGLTNEMYLGQLSEKGFEELSKNAKIEILEGEADFKKTFRYPEDFDLGDIVQFKNEYGFEGRASITEIVFSQDDGGYEVFPSFETIK